MAARQDPNKELYLDMLTKDAKEALLTKKMESIRKQNEALLKRHEEVEADKCRAVINKQAAAAAVAAAAATTAAQKDMHTAHKHPPPPTTEDHDPRRRRPMPQQHQAYPSAQQQQQQQQNNRPATRPKSFSNHNGAGGGGRGPRERPKSQDFRSEEAYEYEPIVDVADLDYRLKAQSPSKGNRDRSPIKPRRNAQHNNNDKISSQSDESSASFHDEYHYKPKRRDRLHEPSQNQTHDLKQGDRGRGGQANRGWPANQTFSRKDQGRFLASDDGPPPDPSYSFLADRTREANSRQNDKGGNQAQQDGVRGEGGRGGGKDIHRHPRNFGGADFNNVKPQMKAAKEKERDRRSFPPRNRLEMSVNMTGLERVQYEEWKAERQKVDQERLERHKNSSGEWRRAWDHDKNYDELQSPNRTEPAKRPVGRIGSGRFARGDCDDRRLDGQNPSAKAPPAVQSTPPPMIDTSERRPLAPGGQARGRGRGRGGRGRGQHGPPGEKPLRPRTWSGADEARTVECSNDMLVVKIDKSRGNDDHSVEVEYEPSDEIVEKKKGPSSKKKPGRKSPTKQRQQHPQQFQDADIAPPLPPHRRGVTIPSPPVMGSLSQESGASYHGRPTSLSQSLSIGSTGTDDWEDVTGTDSCATTTEDEAESSARRIKARLNPDAPVFQPTPSPDLSVSPPNVLMQGFDLSPPKEQRSPRHSLASPRLSQSSSNSAASNVHSDTAAALSCKPQPATSVINNIKASSQTSAQKGPASEDACKHVSENKNEKILPARNIPQDVTETPVEEATLEAAVASKEVPETTRKDVPETASGEENGEEEVEEVEGSQETKEGDVEDIEEQQDEEDLETNQLEEQEENDTEDREENVEDDEDYHEDQGDAESHRQNGSAAAAGSSLADELSAAGGFSSIHPPQEDDDEGHNGDLEADIGETPEPAGEALPDANVASEEAKEQDDQPAQEAPEASSPTGDSQMADSKEEGGSIDDEPNQSSTAKLTTESGKVMEEKTEEPSASVNGITDSA